MPQDNSAQTLNHLLDGMDAAADGDVVSVEDVVEEFGDRSITPFILLVSVLMITPLSGIPGMPTISAAIIVLLSAQALLGRRRVWLPQVLLQRSMSARRLRWAVSWLRRPSTFFDRHAHKRLQILVKGPGRYLTLLMCALIPLGWPLLELVPLVTTFGASIVGLFAFGLFTRDGLYVLVGYMMICFLILIGASVWG
ncbi:exopolysaccharide biosynthesis protein [Sulfitobacter aestuariivivens]|uniref:Exopolysaccharide biosynthesis protein n=1 Tax=Sulfitobacter aestuariivivens TaxID=2766981 RepID=A0A927D6A5_9RHOB|nr:exopolysaccharide biosynthesis protein [Sulfitobacter aestuariivivens]MBD3665008.1 exopolysaccharide biosynthesis protein [Sulfitobacter aestuariivivens]